MLNTIAKKWEELAQEMFINPPADEKDREFAELIRHAFYAGICSYMDLQHDLWVRTQQGMSITTAAAMGMGWEEEIQAWRNACLEGGGKDDPAHVAFIAKYNN